MPTQRTCFGRPINIVMPPRRFQLLFAFIFTTFIFLWSLGSSVSEYPAVAAVTEHIPQSIRDPHLPSIPNSFNPFRPAAHKPPEQENSSAGEARWYSDWRWRNPFSSSVTLEEKRAVLPPLRTRPPIYTYYEQTMQAKVSPEIKDAEERLLFQWRRAWWAQGFKPIVLGKAEALNNPLYKKVQMMGLQDNIDIELMRWLAWGTMGDGILSNWLAFPMASHESSTLTFLRRGSYPQLTKFEKLKSGLYCGSKKDINNAIEEAIKRPEELKKVSDLSDKKFDELFQVAKTDSIAYYEWDVIKENYKPIAETMFDKKDMVSGYRMLSELINAHLQTTWQNTFDKGVAVLKPLPRFMTVLTEQAYEIAGNLTDCPRNPIPTSCPPNNLRTCKRCISSQPKPITTAAGYRNISGLFQLGSVPHPFTTTALNAERDSVEVRFVRRLGFKSRDAWITAITQDWLGQGVSAARRSSSLKEVIAGEHGYWNTLFLTAETEYHEDLDWIFGFDIPRNGTGDGKSETPVPGPERRPKAETKGPVVSQEQLSLERDRLHKIREGLASKSKHFIAIRDAVESWNLADTEIWRFTRAYSARRRLERLKWEDEEEHYAGAEKKGSKSRWGRWFDRD
ncbi:uncharacterized protein PV09_07442 [Verruconis gallopava]|uniref:Uncharacterized protein n=1 Tax=Verruconis gallopava TaxID=253628 RepID=A0A0D1XG32_9PEZI|nr:uncharacterized protein PV09_07442 [Verruconis gallopava]KIW01156.1 hypothetical protein PV09_07442 [Verruconis gallopava]